MWVSHTPPLHLKVQRHLLQLLIVIRINLSAELLLNLESRHSACTEFCGRHYRCFRTRFNDDTPYQFQMNGNEKILLRRCWTGFLFQVSIAPEYGLQTRSKFIWIVPLTDTIDVLGSKNTHICLTDDQSIAQKLKFGLQSAANISLSPVSCEKL